MNTETIKIPVTATYHIIDGVAIMVASEYQEVKVSELAQLLIEQLHVPVKAV